MAKGYWIAHVNVTNADGYKQHTSMLQDIFRKHHARYVTRGGTMEVGEGKAAPRVVGLEVPSYQGALDCGRTPEHDKAIAPRQASDDANLVVVEGYDGPLL